MNPLDPQFDPNELKFRIESNPSPHRASYFTVDGNRNLIPSHQPATKTWNEFPPPCTFNS